MTGASVVFVCVSLFVLTEVAAWTIDLPEVRKLYFDKFSNDEKRPEINSDQIFYDNINGDSLHNTHRVNEDIIDYLKHYEKNLHPISDYLKGQEEKKPNVYANGYNYDFYMVKKVSNGVIANGPTYLDGLRLAIERYIVVLKNCTENNFIPDVAANISLPTRSNSSNFREMCQKATEASEHVRRLADLALHATRRLQDVAYTAMYNKDASMEENELLLRLAWYLDKLAHLTGYEPVPEDFITEEPPRSTTLAPVFNPLNISDEVKMRILNCIREKSDQPATVRCAFPNSPSLTDQIIGLMGPAGSLLTQSPLNDTQRISRSDDNVPSTSLEPEILVATDSRGIMAPTLTGVKSVQKRSLSDENDPLVKQLKYYTKYKVWEFSNAKIDNMKTSHFDVDNHLSVKHREKRSTPAKYNPPENPFQDLSKYVKNKPGLHYIKQVIDLDKIFSKKVLPLKKVKTLKKLLRGKRYVNSDYRKVIYPQVPTNPQLDISYYVKNKEGTNINPSLTQAALLRASLQAVFERGNINVVHRYGSNYNPAVPAPFLLGAFSPQLIFKDEKIWLS